MGINLNQICVSIHNKLEDEIFDNNFSLHSELGSDFINVEFSPLYSRGTFHAIKGASREKTCRWESCIERLSSNVHESVLSYSIQSRITVGYGSRRDLRI